MAALGRESGWPSAPAHQSQSHQHVGPTEGSRRSHPVPGSIGTLTMPVATTVLTRATLVLTISPLLTLDGSPVSRAPALPPCSSCPTPPAHRYPLPASLSPDEHYSPPSSITVPPLPSCLPSPSPLHSHPCLSGPHQHHRPQSSPLITPRSFLLPSCPQHGHSLALPSPCCRPRACYHSPHHHPHHLHHQ